MSNSQQYPALCPGARVFTPTGRTGVILPSPFEMPHHTLLLLDSGVRLWVRTEFLKAMEDKHHG